MPNKPTREARTLVYPRSMTRPEDWLRHVYLPPFERKWTHLGYSDMDLRGLEVCVMVNPKAASVVPGTGGLRKGRFARDGAGKSGGIRVCYVYFEEFGVVYYITLYAKNEQDNLSDAGRRAIKKLIAELEAALKGSGQ